MSATQLREKTSQQLQEELVELRREQFNLRLQKSTAQLGNPARFKELRRDIARIKTVLTEKARAGNE